MKKTLTLALGLLLLAGCSAIPFSTLFKLRNLTPQSFVEMVPQAVMMRLEVPGDYAVDTSQSTITITVGRNGIEHTEVMTMRRLTAQEVAALSRPSEWRDDGNEYVFQLDEPGIVSFKRLQEVVHTTTPDDVRIDVGFAPLTWPQDSEYMPISVDLQFEREQGFFRLLDSVLYPLTEAALKRAEETGTFKVQK